MLPRASHAPPVLLVVLLAGCGTRPAPEPGPAPPKSGDEKLLADLEGQIAAKEKELAELRAKADAVRARLAAGKTGGGATGVSAVQKLIDGIPADEQPRAGVGDTIERSKANDWLYKNLVGKTVELSGKVAVSEVLPASGGTGYYGTLVVGERVYYGNFLSSVSNPGQVRTGGADWKVLATLHVTGPEVKYRNLDEANARRFRDLKGKTVRVAGRDTRAVFDLGNSTGRPPELTLFVQVTEIEGVELASLEKQ
jgi:hypothetical protein